MPNSSRPGTEQARSSLKHSQTSCKRSASGLVDSLISSFAGSSSSSSGHSPGANPSTVTAAGSPRHGPSSSKASSPRAVEFAGAGPSSTLRSNSPLRAGFSVSRSTSPKEDAAAAATSAGASCSYAGAFSASAPVTPSSRSFTEPGTLGPSTKGGLMSSRSLLPDAVFLPEGVCTAGTQLRPYYKRQGTSSSSISLAPDAACELSRAADSEPDAAGDTAGADAWNGLAGSLADFPSFNCSSGGITSSISAAGGQLHCLGSSSFASSAAGCSGSPDPPVRQKSPVSFLKSEHSAGNAVGSSSISACSSAGTAGSSCGGRGAAGSRPPQLQPLFLEEEAALSEVGMQHASELKRSKTTALADIATSSADNSSSSTGKPRLAVLRAVLQKLTVAVDGGSSSSGGGEPDDAACSEAGEPGKGSSSGDGGGQPSGGSSKAQALAYKHQHGYLPSPSASSAGSLSRGFSQKLLPGTRSKPAGSSLSRATSINFDALAADAAAVVARSGQAGLQDHGPAASTAAGSPRSQDVLPALAPGVVPVFAGSGCSSTAMAPGGLEAALNSTFCSISGEVSSSGNKDEADAAAIGAEKVPAARSMRALSPLLDSAAAVTTTASPKGHLPQHQQHHQQQSDTQQYGVQHPLMHAPRPLIVLAPASQAEAVLLAVSPRLAPAMQRARWALSDFKILKKLYDGYASTICKAQDRVSGTTVALKFYHLSKLNSISSHQVAREVRLHIDLDHENIIPLYAAFQEAGSVVLVQDFAPGGDLWAFIDANSGRLTERVTVSLVLQPFLRALQYLHSAGIAHRDIKPENVLFSGSMVLKVADFGLAVNLRVERAVTRVGTLDYMAPEVLKCPLKRHPSGNKDKPDLAYQQSVDSWAVGVLAFELLTGRAPFSAAGASDAAIEVAIKTAAPAFPSRMSEPAREFINAALHKAPDRRASILHMLQHPWIRSFQRSSSNGRAEHPSSQELHRLLLPSSAAAQSPATPARQPQQPAQQRQGLLPALRAQHGASKKSLAAAAGAMSTAAATNVFRADDLGMTGYALSDGI